MRSPRHTAQDNTNIDDFLRSLESGDGECFKTRSGVSYQIYKNNTPGYDDQIYVQQSS